MGRRLRAARLHHGGENATNDDSVTSHVWFDPLACADIQRSGPGHVVATGFECNWILDNPFRFARISIQLAGSQYDVVQLERCEDVIFSS